MSVQHKVFVHLQKYLMLVVLWTNSVYVSSAFYFYQLVVNKL